jgi:hypothetical protein
LALGGRGAILAPQARRFNHPSDSCSAKGFPYRPASGAERSRPGRQAARVGQAKSGGESTPMSLGSETQACFVKPSTL